MQYITLEMFYAQI